MNVQGNVWWVEGPWLGRLAILARPRPGDWLEDEVRSWREAAVAVVVSTLEAEEVEELGLKCEGEACQKNGIEFISHPVLDYGEPASLEAVAELARRLEAALRDGKSVGVHCRAGLGRSPMLAACVLVLAGVGPNTALERISAARGCEVPQTVKQRRWVESFALDLERRRGKGS
jgi:protein-tyrosine phosphatase